MSRKLVIMASKEGREALRNCGVLPASVFKTFSEIDDHDSESPETFEDRESAEALEGVTTEGGRRLEFAASLGFYIWPYDPDYKCESSGFGDFPIISMLGMDPPKSNVECLERKVDYTKLLGSTILHVVLLDEWDPNARSSQPQKRCSLSAQIAWCDTLQSEIRKEYSDEQVVGIDHAFILVARDPRGLIVDKDEVEGFCQRLNAPADARPIDKARIRTCFFLDRHLEVELGDQLFPSAFIWPQMVGRLLLRVLIGLEENPKDALAWCEGGMRLWKSTEFVLDFQQERVHQLMSTGIGKFIEELRTGNKLADTKFSLQPWTPSVDVVLKEPPHWKYRDARLSWNEFQADKCSGETFDESRWLELMRPNEAASAPATRDAHDGDVEYERKRLTNEIHAAMTAADAVHDEVSGWVCDKSGVVRNYFTTGGGAGVSEYWNNIVQLCLRRAQCKDVIEAVVKDYELAKSHFVQKRFCLLSVVAVSLCAGLVFSRVVLALGGGVVLALLMCGGTFAGGLLSMAVMLRNHNKYGRLGRNALLQLCRTADDCIIARDKSAHDQIANAVSIRARMLQLAKMRHFERLVARLQSMITDELVAPSSEVFIEDDQPECAEDDRVSQTLRDQYDRFVRETSFRIGFEAKDEPAPVRVSFSLECERVATAWSALCAEHDPRSTANFPARYFVPFLRRTLRNFRNRYRPEVWRALTESSIEDLIDKFRQSVVGQKDAREIERRIRKFVSDDACYSAHIDLENKHGVNAGAELFYAPLFDSGNWKSVKELWEGIGGVNASNHASCLLLGRTTHFALIFAQEKVGFTVKDGRLSLRVVGVQKEEDDA